MYGDMCIKAIKVNSAADSRPGVTWASHVTRKYRGIVNTRRLVFTGAHELICIIIVYSSSILCHNIR